jgi:hypothetical protein
MKDEGLRHWRFGTRVRLQGPRVWGPGACICGTVIVHDACVMLASCWLFRTMVEKLGGEDGTTLGAVHVHGPRSTWTNASMI